MTTLAATILPSLLSLQRMLHQFWTDDLRGQRLPLAFWKIADEAMFYDALQYLPSCIFVHGGASGCGHSREEIRALPAGFRLAVVLFELEEGFANEGWTAIANAGVDGLQEVVAGYRTIGLEQRAAALERVIAALAAHPDNDDAWSDAAGGELPDLIDDEAASSRVLAYLREDSDAKFGLLPAQWDTLAPG